MLSFEVVGPDRTVKCSAYPPTRAIPREGYREYKPDASASFTVVLHEVCPDSVFSRPGLYAVKAAVWANEAGSEVGVDGFTGRASATTATLLRLQAARDPFYREAPKAVPTPKPPSDDAKDSPAASAPAASQPQASAAPTPAMPKDGGQASR
jgi:hypothetical protein